MSARIEKVTHDPRLHAATLAAFALMSALGFEYAGGVSFLQLWSGSFAAVIATAFLVTKSQGYWFWMVVNSALWLSLFLHQGLPMLAWLQASLLLMSAYGMLRWALVVRWKIGYLGGNLDRWGVVAAAGVFAWSIYAYWNMPGYTGSTWWWVEFTSVATAIAAIAMDAYRYKANWIAWTLSNACSAPLFWHQALLGPFLTLFMYQALNVLGWFVWVREERRILSLHTEASRPSSRRPARGVGMRRGLVFGKFMPLHRGHQLLHRGGACRVRQRDDPRLRLARRRRSAQTNASRQATRLDRRPLSAGGADRLGRRPVVRPAGP